MGAVTGALGAAFACAANQAALSEADVEQQGGGDQNGLTRGDPRAGGAEERKLAMWMAKQNGQVSTSDIGGVPVNVYGGTEAARDAAFNATDRILMDTDQGNWMLGKLQANTEGSWYCLGMCNETPKPFNIILSSTGGSYGISGSDFVVVGLSQVGMQNDAILPGGTFDYERIIAHELGHSVVGITNEWANVQAIENPIMRQLGDPSTRVQY
jgi:hypothetical protein